MPVSVLHQVLSSLPEGPGVYRMLDVAGKDLYIGKAKNLLRRVTSYTSLARLPHRLRQMVHHLQDVRILTTTSELEALLLEANLIQRHQPPYNILLKKGNPFSHLVFTDHAFTRLQSQRTVSSSTSSSVPQGQASFGPFLSGTARDTLKDVIHKVFQVRSCSDFVFDQRTRPCLQYHIQRCSGPCVGKITKEAYQKSIQEALAFLRGNRQQLVQDWTRQMHALASQHDYGRARILRDQIQALAHLRPVQTHAQLAHGDVISCQNQGGITCIQVLCLRHGAAYGAESFFFPDTTPLDAPEIMTSFLNSFYGQNPPPRHLIIDTAPEDLAGIKLVMRHHFGHVPHLITPKRGPLFALLTNVQSQARAALNQHLGNSQTQTELWKQAAQVFGLQSAPKRIEIYDNSHHQGASSVGAMVVASPQGFEKKAYRTFRFQSSKDDYEMMRQMIMRRFRQTWPKPDLMVIDGGKGQMSAVRSILVDLGLDQIACVAIVKRPPSDALLDSQGHEIVVDDHSPVLHLMQRLRDETHRFALATHRRAKRAQALRSPIQDLPGIGPKRYQALMAHFHTPAAIKAASLADLENLFRPRIALQVYQSLQTYSPAQAPQR
jgi:excinuclease ABC subunit C